jgi:hypothetical protein
MRRLFPVAFLAAWKSTTDADRAYFTEMSCRILHDRRPTLAMFIISLIEFMDRNFVSLDIDIIRIADASHSHPFTLFLLQRQFLSGDSSVVPELVETVIQLHGLSRLRAYHRRAGKLDPISDARLRGFLGNWEEALQILRGIAAPLEAMIECLGHLDRHQVLLALNDRMIPSFLWAYYRVHDSVSIERLLSQCPANPPPATRIFEMVWLLSCDRIEEAQRALDDAFLAFAHNRRVIDEYLRYARIYSECQSMLNVKASPTADFVWSRRLRAIVCPRYIPAPK